MAKRATAVRSKDKSSLLLALDHVEVACHGPANYAPYSLFVPGWLVGYDGVIAAGYRVTEDLPGCAPHTETFRHAMMRAGNPFSLTLHTDKLTVRGDAVRVDVPLFPPDAMHNVTPDFPLHEVSPQLSTALIETSKIVAARNDRVIASSVHLRSNSSVGTDGQTILEAYHGDSLPGSWLLPREYVDAISRTKHVATHAGWSDATFTLWFGPNAWLRCNTYQEQYPDTDIIFAKMIADCSEWRNVPVMTLLAVETLKPFLEDQSLMVTPDGINTRQDMTGASYRFEHFLPADACRLVPYNGIRFAAMHGEAISFNAAGFYWYGKQLRGITRA